MLADTSGWWAAPHVLSHLGPALADLHREAAPTLVTGVESRGFLIGSLVAIALGVGFVEIRKEMSTQDVGESVLSVATMPDYNGRRLRLSVRRRLLPPGSRVLLVDDWVDTGATAHGVRQLVAACRGTWVGVAAMVDGLGDADRRRLRLRSLLSDRELGWDRWEMAGAAAC